MGEGKDEERIVNNSSGFKLVNLDTENPEETLKNLQAALWQTIAEGGFGAVDGDLSITGLPMWSEFSKDFEAEVQKILDELDIDPNLLRVVPMYTPQGTGLKRLVENFRAQFPMKQDFEKPISQEKTEAVTGVLLSEVTTAVYGVAHFPPKVWAPMLLIHFVSLVGVIAYMRTVMNWQNRSVHFSSRVFKQALNSLIFIFNYNLTSHWPQIAEAAKNGEITTQTTLKAIQGFAINQGLTTVNQTTFFLATFAYGIYRWAGTRSQNVEESLKARRAVSILVPTIFWISGPVLTMASTSQHVLAQLGPISINAGQLGLLGLAAAGSTFYFKPAVLDPIASFIDNKVYPLLDSLKAKMSWIADVLKLKKKS